MISNEGKELISFVKFVVGFASTAITIIVGVAMFVSWSDLKSMRGEIRAEAKEMKEEVKEIKLNSFKEVQFTKDYAKEQIDAIRLNAEAVAIITSNSKVEEKFANTNLDNLIEEIAKKQVNDKLGILVNKEVAHFEEMITILPELSTALDQIRYGSKKHLVWMDSIANKHSSQKIRKIAKDMIFQKGKDYDDGRTYEPLNGRDYHDNPKYNPYKVCGGNKPETKEEVEAAIDNLVSYILNGKDLYSLSDYFVALRLITNKDFHTFDLHAVKTWYYSR